MTSIHRGRRLSAAALAASLAVAGAAFAPAAATAAPADDIDYFADTIPGLRTGSVFESVTFERFESLLADSGTHAFLIGGPSDPTTAAAAAQIDAVAQEYGVEQIYTFDPLLDGESVDIRTFVTGVEGEAPGALYTRLVENYLNKDNTAQFGADADPYLFIYDGDRVDSSGNDDRIIASLTGAVDAETAASEDYREQVSGVFDAVADGTTLDTQSQYDFIAGAVNTRHRTAYSTNLEAYGETIFTPEDADHFVLKSITYPELVHLLESGGDQTILFGGTWCHNTRAVVRDVNNKAAQAGVETVYLFDLRLDGWSGANAHIRDSNSSIAHLYGDLVSTYLPDLKTQYRLDGSPGQRVDYHPAGDASAPLAAAQKLQVPYLIEYSSGAEAPVTKNWIRDNGDGTYREYMTEWWWIDDLQGPAKRPNQTDEQYEQARQENLAFADEALLKLDEFFGLEAEATVPSAPAAPTVTAEGDAVTISWTPPAFDGGTAITGYTISLGALTAEVAADITTHTFTGVPAGTHSASVTALNEVGASPASVAVPITVGDQSGGGDDDLPGTGESTVAVTGDLRPGGEITVRGAGFGADTDGVRVELHSTPQLLGTVATDASGAFSLTAKIPASTSAGAHSVVVFVGGVEVARTAITVSGAAADSGPDLAVTGADIAPIIAWTALAVLLIGTGIWLFLRRVGGGRQGHAEA